VEAPEGLASGSVAMRRTSDHPYKVEYFPTALANVARQTKPLDTAFVVDGHDVNEAFLRYARPLAGELPVPGRLL
jgi:hypothetical protein